MSEAQSLINDEKLQKLELRLHDNEKVLESFFLQINFKKTAGVETEIEELETELAQIIHRIATCLSTFQKVPKECCFKILLHTSSCDFSNESLKDQVTLRREMLHASYFI